MVDIYDIFNLGLQTSFGPKIVMQAFWMIIRVAVAHGMVLVFFVFFSYTTL